MSEPRFFATRAKWRAWLEKHHNSKPELDVGFHKKGSGLKSMTYPEAVEEALCFGWIDGVRYSIDATSYRNRFTPRRKGSYWSDVNLAKAEELIAQGRMHPAGLAEFEKRDRSASRRYSFEQRKLGLSAEYEATLRANVSAWEFFQAMPPSYRKPASWWVMSAKKEETRQRRLATLIECSAARRKVPPLAPPSEKRKG